MLHNKIIIYDSRYKAARQNFLVKTKRGHAEE